VIYQNAILKKSEQIQNAINEFYAIEWLFLVQNK